MRTKAGSDVDPRQGLDADLETCLLLKLATEGLLVGLPGAGSTTGQLPALELAPQGQQHTPVREHHSLEYDEALALDDARRYEPPPREARVVDRQPGQAPEAPHGLSPRSC